MLSATTREQGFSLIELISVLILASVLAAVAIPGLVNTDAQRLQAARDDLLAALRFAQQIAQSRSESGNQVALSFSGSTVSVMQGGVAQRAGDVQYPLSLGNGVSLVSSVSSPLVYDKLGRTTAAVFTLTLGGSSATVSVSGAGYAY